MWHSESEWRVATERNPADLHTSSLLVATQTQKTLEREAPQDPITVKCKGLRGNIGGKAKKRREASFVRGKRKTRSKKVPTRERRNVAAWTYRINNVRLMLLYIQSDYQTKVTSIKPPHFTLEQHFLPDEQWKANIIRAWPSDH